MSNKADCVRCERKCSHALFNPQYCPFETETDEDFEKQKRLAHFDALTKKAKEKLHHA